MVVSGGDVSGAAAVVAGAALVGAASVVTAALEPVDGTASDSEHPAPTSRAAAVAMARVERWTTRVRAVAAAPTQAVRARCTFEQYAMDVGVVADGS